LISTAEVITRRVDAGAGGSSTVRVDLSRQVDQAIEQVGDPEVGTLAPDPHPADALSGTRGPSRFHRPVELCYCVPRTIPL